MFESNSPWIKQLKRTRPIEPLEENLETDVVIIGGGIAGVTTAYFTLLNTKNRVVLLEANKIAHGATGHNAGQITSYLEKPFGEIVALFGSQRAANGYRAIEEDARILLEQIYSHTLLTTPRSEFIGYEGLSTINHVLEILKELLIKSEAGLRIRPLLIAHEWDEYRLLPSQYAGLYVLTTQKNILSVLETNDTKYIAVEPFLSGCMNSALFTEELVGFLLAAYKDRFTLKEHTSVSSVTLENEEVVVATGTNTIAADCVVLCTNGFETIKIINNAGIDIDGRFHMEVSGRIGYMAAYKEPLTKQPFAASYANPKYDTSREYYYVTRRPFEDEENLKHNIVCIGGPETFVPDRGTYDAKKEYPLEVTEVIENFAAQTYSKPFTSMDYHWHGLMGYTKSGLRLVGHEPRNRRLLYNLGCNGVGILTSVYGAERISRLLNKEVLPHSIFDPS